jgi:hypothetical protein
MTNDLDSFLKITNIPKIKRKPKTFLGIAKQPHYENVLSNIYAFYFNVDEEHGFKDLFLSTLKIIISEKIDGKNFDGFEDPFIETESRTKKDGRIDLLLQNKTSAIIIENKVYHHLNNDLDDYWESIQIPSDKNKVGIILSLNTVNKSQYKQWESADHYINITHLEFMERVMNNLDSYKQEASSKFIVFLEDFYQNIKNLSQSIMNDKNLKFYLEHRTPIHKAATLKYRFKEHVKNEVVRANLLLDIDLELNNSKQKEKLVYYVSKKNPDLMLTLVFEQLFEAKNQLQLFVELTNEGKKIVQNNLALVKGFKSLKLNSFNTTKTNWGHYAYENLKMEQLELLDLSSSIANRINNSPLLEIFKILEEALPKTSKA